jgi:hypothetical protein
LPDPSDVGRAGISPTQRGAGTTEPRVAIQTPPAT